MSFETKFITNIVCLIQKFGGCLYNERTKNPVQRPLSMQNDAVIHHSCTIWLNKSFKTAHENLVIVALSRQDCTFI